MKYVLILLIAMAISSCGGARVKSLQGFVPRPEVTHLEGIKQTIPLGETMTSSAPLVIYKVAEISIPIQSSTTHRNKVIHLQANPGKYNLVRENIDGKYYEAAGNNFETNRNIAFGGIFISANTAIKSGLYWSSSPSTTYKEQPMHMYMSDIDALPEIKFLTYKLPPNNHQGFVSTLSYAGIAAGQIKFVYREYSDGMARAPYTQDVSLDYIKETTYAYKNARFIVHDANTSEVKFTLLQAL
jgi:hypothetical protein